MNLGWLPLADVSIKRKVVLIAMAATLAALLLSTAAYLASEIAAARQQLREDLEVTAALIGSACAAALSFDDPHSAAESLGTLSAKPWVVAARLFDRRGAEFARYLAADAAPPPSEAPFRVIERGRRSESHFERTAAHHWAPILLDREQIGVIHLVADTSHLERRIARQVAIAAAAFLLASLAALAFAGRMQTAISAPVLDMLATMRSISQQGDLAARAERWGRDELGQLADGLNRMLVEIQAHAQDRDHYSDRLEREVAQRTIDLSLAKNRAEQASALNAERDFRLRLQNATLAALVADPALHSGDLAAATRLITEA